MFVRSRPRGAHAIRNLLGRLHARPPADLDRIAAYWRVPLGSGDRHSRVGALYRVMIDPVAARDVWARLTGDEAAMLRLLATGDAREPAPTLTELAAGLAVPETEARETALRLYRAGLLAREGDADELPVGEVARLFLPRELSLLFRRILDEIDLGDRSQTPLKILIEWLDDGELDEAAETWGVTTVPGVRHREEIGRRLLRQIADGERIAKVVRSLGADARQLWEVVRSRSEGEPVPLVEAMARFGGSDEPRSAARVRHALGQLERSLLVWHTYRSDGSRWLFAPREVVNPQPQAAPPLPPLLPLLPIAVSEPLPRPPYALAWDLLSVLREMLVAPWPAEGDLSRARLRSLNRRLWNTGPDLPPTGYLSFLSGLAIAGGLVEEGGDEPVLRPTAALRAWRGRSFAEQSERLRGWWLASEEWTEGRDRDDVEAWGVDWPRMRRRLLSLLSDPRLALSADRWYALDPLAVRIAAIDPDLLGRSFTAATARLAGEVGAGVTEEEARAAAIAEVVVVTFQTAFAWFGIVDLAESASEGHGLRLSPAGLVLSRGEPPPNPEPVAGPSLSVDHQGVVVLHDPTPARVWSLSAFTEAESLRPEACFRLTEASVRRALEVGVAASTIQAFLERNAGATLAEPLVATLTAWRRSVRRTRIRRAFVLQPDDPNDTNSLVALAATHGWDARPISADGILLIGAGDDGTVLDALREAGFAPVVMGEPGRRRQPPEGG